MKKVCRLLLFLAILLAAVHGCLAEESSGWIEVEYDKSPFLYSDELLMVDEHELNPDIAKISMALSAAAYDEPTVRDVLQQMGFEPLVSGYYTMTDAVVNMDRVGYTIARKTSGDYTIYCVPVRGTLGVNEWISDFNLLRTLDGYMAGFGLPAVDVWEDLMDLVESDGTTSDKRIFLLTGHSRGGAVANIVAGKLMEKHLGRVFGYNFACPNVFFGSAEIYDNIHNFNFSNDLVPRVPLESWGFTRYGIDHFADAVELENVFMQKADMDTIMTALGTLDPDHYDAIRLVTTLMSWSIVDGDMDLLREMLSQISDDNEGLIYLVSDGRGLGADNAAIQLEYANMLSFWDENRQTMSTIADESWMDFRSRDEYTAVFTLYDQTAGQTINTYAELEALIPTLRQRYTAINEVASIQNVLDQLFDGSWRLKNVFKSPFKAHNNGYYVQWMNRDYYGYEGKKGQNYENICLNLNVRTIGPHCFDGTTGSFEVNLNGVDAIAKEAFQNCDGLTAVEISHEQEYVGYRAFSNCEKLTDVTLPADYGYNDYFSGSPVETLTYTPGETGVVPDRVEDTNAFYTTYTSLYMPELDLRDSLKHIVFEEGITHIGDYLCSSPGYNHYSAKALQSVTLPSTLQSIGKYSFNECSALTTVNFSDATVLESIGEYGFANCRALQGITLPDSLSSMGSYCFASCRSLTEVNIPSSLAVIPGCAFQYCNGLTEVTIPDTVESIRSSAFGRCTGLKKVTIAANVSSFSNGFAGSAVETIVYTPGTTGVVADRVQDTNATYTTYTSYYAPELDTRETLKQIIFEEGITHIGDYLCSNPGYNNNVSSTALQSVTLPSTLQSIGKYSFEGCSALTTVNFADATVLESIGEYGFANCRALQGITLPDSLSSMGSYCFASCHSLTEVNIPSSLAEIPGCAFQYCNGLTEVTIPETVESIRSSAFGRCTGLKKVTIAANVSSFSNGFAGSKVETIVYTPGTTGVVADRVQDTNATYTTYTSYYAPELDTRETLKQIIFEEGITHIGDYLCSNPGYNNNVSSTALQSVTLPSTLQSIGKYSFNECSALTTVNFSDATVLESIGEYGFANCSALQGMTLPDSLSSMGSFCFTFCSSLTEVNIPSSLAVIPGCAFQYCNGLTEVTIPETVESIRSSAFGRCTGLKKVTIAANVASFSNGFAGSAVETIVYTPGTTGVVTDRVYDEGAFYDTYTSYYAPELDTRETLKHIIFEEGITHIGDYLCSSPGYKHYSATALQSVTLPSTLQSIGKYSFEGCSALTTVNFTDAAKLESIGEYGFANCSALQGMTLPDSISSMGSFCFTFCSSLTEVNIPSSLAVIPGCAFQYCNGLTEVTIPDTVESIRSSAFGRCTGLKKVTIAANVSSLSNGFAGSKVETLVYTPGTTGVVADRVQDTNATYTTYTSYYAPELDTRETLKQIIFEEGITHIGDYLCSSPGYKHYSATALQSITLPSTLQSIGKYSFNECSALTTVNFTDAAKLESIGEYGFANCSALQGMTLPDSLSSMGSFCFTFCSSLTEVNIPSSLTEIPGCAFQYCSGLTEVTIPDTVESIRGSAFGNCKGLKKLTIAANVSSFSNGFAGSKVETIVYTPGTTGVVTDRVYDEGAFYDTYTSYYAPELDTRETLKQIIFEEGITHIGDYLCSSPGYKHYSATALQSVTLPSTLQSIGKYSFNECSALTTVNFTDAAKLESIGEYGFANCSALQGMTLPDSLSSMGSFCFTFCRSLTQVNIPSSLTEIPGCAFQYCSGLMAVTIPDTVKSIRGSAFGQCSNLVSIVLPEGLTNIRSYAFYDCPKLIDITFLHPADAELSIGSSAFEARKRMSATVRVPDPSNIHPAISGYSWSSEYRNVVYANVDLSFRITRTNSTIAANTPIALYAINLPEGCFMSDVAWSVDDDTVAQIAQDGSLTFSRAGFATISAEIPQKGAKCELKLECEGTSVIRLPAMLRRVEAEAFEGLTAEIVVIPAAVECVEDRAFANCPNLYKIIVENPATLVEEGAFEGSPYATVLSE